MKNIKFNRQSFQNTGAAFARFWAEVPYVVLIQHFMLVRLVLLVGLLLIALAAVWTLLYMDSSSLTNDAPARPLVFNTDTLDELELWLETRQSEAEQPIMTGSREYFKE